jgi:hypothetical protein
MAINFPSTPTLNQVYTSGDRTWTWNGRYWKATSTTVGYTGSLGYTGSAGSSAVYSRTSMIATAGQTSFAVAYSVGYLQVYLNGVLLNASDYVATTGATVVLDEAAAVGDLLEFINYNVAPPIAAAPPATLNSTNLTSSFAVTAGYSAVSVGPLTVADGVTISIAAGQKWVIL